MILCIAPNVTLERTWVVPNYRPGGVFRVKELLVLPSGKGINVARAIKTLGCEPLGMGFVAGHIGALIADLAVQQNLVCAWTWIEGETRLAVAVIDPEAPDSDATLTSEAGPTIQPGDWERLAVNVLERAKAAQMACFSGSLPPGTPLQGFSALIRALQELGCPVWVDCSGPWLEEAIQAGGAGIKVNGEEIGEMLGFAVVDIDTALQAAQSMRRMGAGSAIVTLGSKGAVMVAPQGSWMAEPPNVKRISSVGSGDAFMAGLLTALEKKLDPAEALRSATAAGAANVQMLGGGRFQRADYDAALLKVQLKKL
jgi:1-phosphofructokinase family hexose kinase